MIEIQNESPYIALVCYQSCHDDDVDTDDDSTVDKRSIWVLAVWLSRLAPCFVPTGDQKTASSQEKGNEGRDTQRGNEGLDPLHLAENCFLCSAQRLVLIVLNILTVHCSVRFHVNCQLPSEEPTAPSSHVWLTQRNEGLVLPVHCIETLLAGWVVNILRAKSSSGK